MCEVRILTRFSTQNVQINSAGINSVYNRNSACIMHFCISSLGHFALGFDNVQENSIELWGVKKKMRGSGEKSHLCGRRRIFFRGKRFTGFVSSETNWGCFERCFGHLFSKQINETAVLKICFEKHWEKPLRKAIVTDDKSLQGPIFC